MGESFVVVLAAFGRCARPDYRQLTETELFAKVFEGFSKFNKLGVTPGYFRLVYLEVYGQGLFPKTTVADVGHQRV